MAEMRRSRTVRVDPKRPLRLADANVGYPIAKRSFNDSDKIDGSTADFFDSLSQNRSFEDLGDDQQIAKGG